VRPGWPQTTDQSEQWRSDEISRCLHSIEKADSSQYPVKEAFERSVAALTNELIKVLSMVRSVDGDTRSDMKSLANKAARMWLDLGSRHFRIQVVIPDQTVKSIQNLSTRPGYRGLVELVIKPELRRAGNSMGGDLNREEVISGCKGEFSSFQTG
jgi:hypothetical protein